MHAKTIHLEFWIHDKIVTMFLETFQCFIPLLHFPADHQSPIYLYLLFSIHVTNAFVCTDKNGKTGHFIVINDRWLSKTIKIDIDGKQSRLAKKKINGKRFKSRRKCVANRYHYQWNFPLTHRIYEIYTSKYNLEEKKANSSWWWCIFFDDFNLEK